MAAPRGESAKRVRLVDGPDPADDTTDHDVVRRTQREISLLGEELETCVKEFRLDLNRAAERLTVNIECVGQRLFGQMTETAGELVDIKSRQQFLHSQLSGGL